MNQTQCQSEEASASLSAYMDGELPVEYRDGLLADIKSDGSLRAQWSLYHCIGDVLRSEDMACHSASIQQKFSARIEAEPFLFAPEVANTFAAQQAATRSAWRMPAAIAAGVAAVVVTGAAVILPLRDVGVLQSAAAPAAVPAPPAALALAGADTGVRPVSNEYLIAHRHYSNGLAIQGVVSHVRTAGYDGK